MIFSREADQSPILEMMHGFPSGVWLYLRYHIFFVLGDRGVVMEAEHGMTRIFEADTFYIYSLLNEYSLDLRITVEDPFPLPQGVRNFSLRKKKLQSK